MRVYMVEEEYIDREGVSIRTVRGVFHSLHDAARAVREIAPRLGVTLEDTEPRLIVGRSYVMSVSWGHMFHIQEYTVRGTPPEDQGSSRWCPFNLVFPKPIGA